VTFRLAVATARYPPLTGGVELHSEEVARRLAARGVRVTVLTTDRAGRLPSTERLDGVEVQRYRAWPPGRDYYFSPGLHRAVRHGAWDLLHVQGFQTLVAPSAMLAALRARIPYVVTFHQGGHSSRLRQTMVPFQERLLRPLLARADRLVALTQSEAEHRARRLRLDPDRVVVIPNGCDLPGEYDRSEREPGLIASIGRLERYKGHHRVIAALPYIAARRPEARLWIAGTGPYKAELLQLAEHLGVAQRVEIRPIPILERTQMARELSRVSVAVFLSEFEAHGIAVLEALGRGCRVVVARSPGLLSLAEQGLARGVPLECTPATVADAVLAELEQPPLEELPALPTWDGCTEALHQLYEAVMQGRGPR
jgi:glycosyltransferase involved in cell wall biosynthesis